MNMDITVVALSQTVQGHSLASTLLDACWRSCISYLVRVSKTFTSASSLALAIRLSVPLQDYDGVSAARLQ